MQMRMAADWFRKTTWSAEDARDFERRLKRAREFNKAQYLRIQAAHLHRVGTAELTHIALELLDRLLSEHPDRVHLAEAHHQRGSCLALLGRPDEAIAAFREALATQRSFPNVRTTAHQSLAELVVKLARADLYDEALEALDEFGHDDPWPVSRYRAAVVRALIAEARSRREDARVHAREALAAAAKTESPFRFHRSLGLVGDQQPDLEAKLKALASD
jgi:tetratricopeptide (TPR) repeat protein